MSELEKKFLKHHLLHSFHAGSIHQKPSYLSAENFATILIDILREANDQDGNTTATSIRLTLESSDYFDKNSEGVQKILQAFWKEIAPDPSIIKAPNKSDRVVKKFRKKIESWYNDTMDRSIGWYKKNINVYLMIIGFTFAVAFNVSSIAVVKELSKNKKAQEALLIQANQIIYNPEANKKGEGEIDSLYLYRERLIADMNNIQSTLGIGKLPPEISVAAIVEKKPKTNSTTKTMKKVKVENDPSDHYCPPRCKKNHITHIMVETEVPAPKENASKAYYFNIDSKYKASFTAYAPKDIKEVQKYYELQPAQITNDEGELIKHSEYKLVLKSWDYTIDMISKHFWGYLITALAISLGANFWFELLNKLVNLRNSLSTTPRPGKKEQEASKK